MNIKISQMNGVSLRLTTSWPPKAYNFLKHPFARGRVRSVPESVQLQLYAQKHLPFSPKIVRDIGPRKGWEERQRREASQPALYWMENRQATVLGEYSERHTGRMLSHMRLLCHAGCLLRDID